MGRLSVSQMGSISIDDSISEGTQTAEAVAPATGNQTEAAPNQVTNESGTKLETTGRRSKSKASEKEDEAKEKKDGDMNRRPAVPPGPGVTVCGLFRFASFGNVILILIGLIFAVLEGAGPAFMAIVFGGMTNILVRSVQSGFLPEPSDLANSTAAAAAAISPAAGTPVNPFDETLSLEAVPQLTASEFESRMASYSLYYIFIGVAMYISSVIQITCWQTTCERQAHRIRRAFFLSVLRQELAWFNRNQSGELAAKFNDDIERIRDGLGEQFSSIVKYSSSFLCGFLVGFIVSWRLTLVIIAVTPLLAAFSAYLGRMLATSTKREQEKYATAGALAEEVLTSVRTVFALGGQRHEIKNYRNKLEEGKRMAQRKIAKLSLVLGASMFVLFATYGLALYVATNLIAAGLLNPGGALSVIMAVMMGASALGNIIPPLQTIAMAMASARLVYDVIDSKPRIDAFAERGLKLSKVTANIRFERVNFSYPLRAQVPVLRDLNFELSQGQTVAICGRTGSGKSTIMNLLMRFYDPNQGTIYLDNCNLRDLNVAWLRSLIGIVEQEPALFDCSIWENIALGASQESDRSLEQVIEAAKRANVHNFISQLPEGYETRCGDRGVQMSGGQKQRIAIARALLSEPKILLLDEATSALDSESEALVQGALNQARKGRTTLIIAHRLSTIREADLICVMEAGRIVEMGRHEELMQNRAEYYNLVTNQVFAGESDGAPEPTDDSNSDSGRLRPLTKRSAHGWASDSSGDERRRAAARRPTGGQNSDESTSADEDQRAAEDSLLLGRRPRVSAPKRTSGSTGSGGGGGGRGQSSKGSSSYAGTVYESIERPPPPAKSFADFQLESGVSASPDGSATTASFSSRDLLWLLRPELRLLVVSLVLSMISGALMPIFALFYAQIFDTFTKTGDELLESGAFWALMFLVLALAHFLALALRVFSMANTIEIVMARLRCECFTSILRQQVSWFDESQHSAQRLSTRLASDVPQIKAVLNSRLSAFTSGLSTIVAALAIAFYLGWQLALVLMVALPILLYVGFVQMRMSRGDRQQHTRRMENASRLATESIEQIKLIQAITKERYFFDKFARELQFPLDDSLSSARRFGLVYGLSQSCIYFVYAAAFRWAAYLMARQIIDATNVFRIFFAIAFTAVAVGQWGGLGGDMSRTNQAIGMLLRLLRQRPLMDNLSRAGIKPRLKGNITIQELEFAYPARPEAPVLCGLSLQVAAGETLALVGASGSGKSTIAALLLRFYDPTRGVLRIDNFDIRCINLNHLRLNVGLVSQEPVLFKASIKDNILYGLDKWRYSMRDVQAAAKLANVHEFIESLPQGYNTQVGERGSQLSGGQKQRIAIARTLIRDPPVLILDEATSALDAESEQLVNEALERAAKGKTCIKIAHRLSTVRDADQIAVIKLGRVVECGSHDELMALGARGHYFRLMQKQSISA